MELVQQQMADPEKAKTKTLRRKRVFVDGDIDPQEKKNLIEGFYDELRKLYEYFPSVLSWKLGQEEGESTSVNSAIACMLEGSSLPFSKLACEIHEKLKERGGVTLTSIQRDVHFIGSRLNYGITNGNPDLLEDLSESCLWCWEVRDMKWLPKQRRKMCAAQRKAREKIRDRVVALSEILSVLRMQENEGNYKALLLQASEKLGKTLNQEQISSVFEKLALKCTGEINSNRQELLKEIEKNMRIAEKEKKKLDRQLEKERWESEREAKRRQIEAEKEEKRREREEFDLQKKLRRAKEEAEREQKSREKEEIEAKKLLSVKKQATIMQRFLKIKKSNDTRNRVNELTSTSSLNDGCLETVISLMDSKLSQENDVNLEDLRKSHIAVWLGMRHRYSGQRWGVRRNPKAKIFSEIKLQGSSSAIPKSDSKKIIDLVDDDFGDGQPLDHCDDLTITRNQVPRRATKLLQFDKSYRPPYYGSCFKMSDTVKPRCPLAKDPSLDYEVDSDEEWEEEEPGESLSDCEKDEDEVANEGPGEDDEDESDDGFFVPDGYLSENEGVRLDHSAEVSPSDNNLEVENEEFGDILQQQKHLDFLTQQALRRNQPLIKCYLGDSDIALTKAEQICQLALCLIPVAGGSVVDLAIEGLDSSLAVPSPDSAEKVKELKMKPGVASPAVKGQRGGTKGKRQASPSGSGTVKLPDLLAAVTRKTVASEGLSECWENMQSRMA